MTARRLPQLVEMPWSVDIDLLVKALLNGLLPARHWLAGETTTENFARWLIAEYARLAEREEDE